MVESMIRDSMTCLYGDSSFHEEHGQGYHPAFTGNPSSKKNLIFETGPEGPENWRSMDPHDWSRMEVFGWIGSTISSHGSSHEHVNSSAFRVIGTEILNFSENDFVNRDLYFGRILYNALRKLLEDRERQRSALPGLTDLTEQKIINEYSTLSVNYPGENTLITSPTKLESEPSEAEEHVTSLSKERPLGNNPKVKTKKRGRIWEFIIWLLHNPQFCPSLIKWADYANGVFQFVESNTVAKIWGERKGNERMNYEKMSRTIRHNYKKGVFAPVHSRKLVYKFGPAARGWQCDNPNFGKND